MTSELPSDIMEKNIDEIEKTLTKKDLTDVVYGIGNIFLSLIKTIGYVPPEIQTAQEILNYTKENFGSTVSQRRQFEFLMLLYQRLIEIEANIDKEFIKSEEFELYIQRFLDEIKHEQYREKVLAFRNAIANISTRKISNNLEIEYFINSLLSFSDLHFLILSFFHKPEDKLKEKNINIEDYKTQTGGVNRILEHFFNGINMELVSIASRDLKEKGYTSQAIPFGGGLGTETDYQKLVRSYITDLGKKFIAFCMVEQ